ncbi:MAG: HesA/MoeB/ThiF family protein [Caldisericaceae bacterium]
MLSKEELGRYNRQIRIDKIGKDGQLKLKSASVVVVGAGGLGSPILMYLAAAGVGRIGFIDGDEVSISNLNRQVLYDSYDVGKKKTQVATEKLKKLNPNLSYEAYPLWLSDLEVAENIFIKYDAVIDATDNFETRYLVNKVCVALNKPLFIGAVGRFSGQVTDVMPHKSACFNCIFPEKEKEIVNLMTEKNLSEGIIGTLVGTIGTIVASEFIKFTLGIGSNLFDKLLIYDLLNDEFSIINIERNPHCSVCGDSS